MSERISSGKLREKRLKVLHRLHDRMQADLNGSRLSLQQRPFVKAQQNALAWALAELGFDVGDIKTHDRRDLTCNTHNTASTR